MKKKFILWTSIVSIVLSLIIFLSKALISDSIDSAGIIHEPFFLLPLGYLFLFVGIILGITYFIQNKRISK